MEDIIRDEFMLMLYHCHIIKRPHIWRQWTIYCFTGQQYIDLIFLEYGFLYEKFLLRIDWNDLYYTKIGSSVNDVF